MECPWDAHGPPINYSWTIDGLLMECPWNTHDQLVGQAQATHGRPTGGPLPTGNPCSIRERSA